MICSIFRAIKGAITLTLISLITIICAVVILIFFGIAYLVPIRAFRHGINKYILQKIPGWHMFFIKKALWLSTRNLWDVQGTHNLKQDGWYLMISNHQSWIDIIVLGTVFNYVIPPLKFFMKKELLWQLPLAGPACYALGYPFVARHTHAEIRKNPKLKGKDIQSALKACEKLRKYPATLINFIEGTRFTQKKYEKQNSPFKYLLKPRAGGLSITLQALHDVLDGIVNVTILYPGKKPSLWEFACGNFEKVIVRYELLPVTPNLIGDYQNNRPFRAEFQQWLNAVWQRNDSLLEQLTKSYER